VDHVRPTRGHDTPWGRLAGLACARALRDAHERFTAPLRAYFVQRYCDPVLVAALSPQQLRAQHRLPVRHLDPHQPSAAPTDALDTAPAPVPKRGVGKLRNFGLMALEDQQLAGLFIVDIPAPPFICLRLAPVCQYETAAKEVAGEAVAGDQRSVPENSKAASLRNLTSDI